MDIACVTNRFEYDALDRRVAAIDGRNNRTVYAYDAKNNLVSVTDAVGAVTSYGYEQRDLHDHLSQRGLRRGRHHHMDV